MWWTLLVTASPVVALPLAVGGDDLPVLGLMRLGLAPAGRAARGHWPWVAGAGVGVWLAIRPPRDAHDAGWRLALGLALLFALAPASRVGYFVYPLGLAGWLLLCRWPELPGDLSADPEPQHRLIAVHGHESSCSFR